MSDRKKFKDTKIGKFLKEKAPKVLEAIGESLPDRGVLGLVKNLIDKDENLSETDKAHALRLIELELEADKEITSRWKSDMTSDSWLSKNARPAVLFYSWILITVLCIMSFFKVEIPMSYVPLIEALAVSVNVAYFGSRGFEKYTALRQNK